MTRQTVSFNEALTFTRASTKWVWNATGTLVEVPIDQPAYDHDPVTGEALGVLIEESRTNLLTYSEQLDNAAWTKRGATISANASLAPDGNTTADKLVEDTTNSSHFFFRNHEFLAGVTYTASVLTKAAERSVVRMLLPSTAFSGNKFVYFDLSTGTALNGSSGTTARIVELADGYYRCSITATATDTSTNTVTIAMVLDATGTVYQGDGTSGLYIWGAQLEEGSTASSYIPTAGAAVTRAADNIQTKVTP